MERLADRRAVGHGIDQPIGEIPRVRGDEPKARDCRASVGGAEVVDRADELGEVRAAPEVELPARPALGPDVPESRFRREVVPVRVDVLAEERDLAEALRGDRAGFVDDLVERSGSLGAAAERDDAVGAGLVAAVDDRQPRAHAGVAMDRGAGDRGGARAGEVVRDADRGPADDRRRADRAQLWRGREPDRPLRGREPQPVDELRLLVGPEEQVDRREPPVQPVPVHLADRAAGHDDAHRRVRVLELRELALPADDLRLGRLTDRAGVDDDEVRRVHRRRLGAPGREQPAGHLLRVAAVHLAAERPDVEPGQGARFGPELTEPLVRGIGRRPPGGGRRRGDLEHRQQASGRHGRAMLPPCPLPVRRSR